MISIEHMIRGLREARITLDDRQLAEVLWLAGHLPPQGEVPEAEVTPEVAEPAVEPEFASDEDEAPAPPTEASEEPPDRPGGRGEYLYPDVASVTMDVDARASRIRAPTATALPGVLEISRAMRPFGRRFPSRRSFVIDEEATVERIAEGGTFAPVLRPARERWFDVALVVEDAPSMVIWQRTADELQEVLETVGTFADVRRWRLSVVAGQAVLSHPSGGVREPGELKDPAARRLIIVMTDGVSDGWRQGILQRTLADWATTTPVVIAQVLPERLWPRTALGIASAEVSAPTPGAANRALQIRRPWWDEEPLGGRIAVLPFTLQPVPIGRCARMLMVAGATAPALLIAPRPAEKGTIQPDKQADKIPTLPLTAEERLERFAKMVSPQAFDLAAYFSAIPLNLPVMRIVQKKMAPAARQEHLAEVFVGGIIERVTPASEPCSAEEIAYDFSDGVRSLLQRSLRRGEVVDVLAVVSRFVERRFGHALDFGALIEDSAGADEVPADLLPFARIGSELLARVLPISTGVAGKRRKGRRSAQPPLINLPPPPEFLVGRKTILGQVVDTLLAPRPRASATGSMGAASQGGRPGPGIVTLVGPEGIGKFTLARALVREPRVYERYLDGIVWLGEDGSGYPRQWLREYAAAVGVPPPINERDLVDRERFQAIFSDRRVLFIADQRSAPDMVPTLIEHAGRRCTVLRLLAEAPASISAIEPSTVRIEGRDVRFIPLAPLDDRALGEIGNGGERGFPVETNGNPLIARLLCGYSQLARASSFPASDVVSGDAVSKIIRALWGHLSEELRSGLARLASLVRRRTIIEKASFGVRWREPGGLIEQLTQMALLEDLGERVRLHPLVRSALFDLTQDEADSPESQEPVYLCYGEDDGVFGWRLWDDLVARGVDVSNLARDWAPSGAVLQDRINRLPSVDAVILVLSETALDAEWIIRIAEEAQRLEVTPLCILPQRPSERLKNAASSLGRMVAAWDEGTYAEMLDSVVRALPPSGDDKPTVDALHIDIDDIALIRDVDAPWCPELIALPAGTFIMGSQDDERERFDDEGPQREVTIASRFAIGRYAVTFEEYDRFCEATGWESPDDQGWGRGRRPVINVSWREARAYCQWLTEETGQPYRLASEAEWEYACRAGTTTRYAFGDDIDERIANFGSKVGQTTEVGSYPPNAWGLCEMHGNVWEMVEDVWQHSYEGAPNDGSAWTDVEGEQSSRHRVLRGGSWLNYPGGCRSACRNRAVPGDRSFIFGFRVARTLS